jgi:hypothetical protein
MFILQEENMATSRRHFPQTQLSASSEPLEPQGVVLEMDTIVLTNGAVKNL